MISLDDRPNFYEMWDNDTLKGVVIARDSIDNMQFENIPYSVFCYMSKGPFSNHKNYTLKNIDKEQVTIHLEQIFDELNKMGIKGKDEKIELFRLRQMRTTDKLIKGNFFSD